MMYKAYKFKLIPTKEQDQILTNWVGQNRFIWNWALERNREHYKTTKKFLFGTGLISQLPKLKKDLPWLSEIPAQALQQRLRDLDDAFKRCFKSKFGFPKFKSKHIESHNTLRFPQDTQIEKSRIKIPKLGWISWKQHREIFGKTKSVTIKQENGFWWAVVISEFPDPIEIVDVSENLVSGLDLGIKDFCIMDTGEVFESKKYLRNGEKKIKRLQRQLSRKTKGSKNRIKARKKVSRKHLKVKNQRKDYLHKVSTQIANDNYFVCTENLNVKGMIKNRRLSKSISDQGWSMFIGMLEYKLRNRGGKLVRIGRFEPTSKTCSNCGSKKINLSLNIRVYKCDVCGISLDRDHNAAINIKRLGLEQINRSGSIRIHACGESSIGDGNFSSRYDSLKQEECFFEETIRPHCKVY